MAAGAAGAAMTFLPVAGATAETAIRFMDAQARMLNEKFKMAFGGYDLEKVFWQVTFGEGILLVAKLAYEAFKVLSFFIKDPAGVVWGAITDAGKGLVDAILWPPRELWKLVWGEPMEPEEPPPTEAELLELRKASLAKIGIPLFVDQIFNEWLVYLILVVLALPALFEFRRVQRFKKGLK